MSDYLVQRIAASNRITLHIYSAVVALHGEKMLGEIEWADVRSGVSTRIASRNLFVMIGAEPNTEWLNGCVAIDAGGFVETGRFADLDPSPYQTSRRGIYSVGDVRSGSVKRVAAGVGEGSVVVQAIHAFLEAE